MSGEYSCNSLTGNYWELEENIRNKFAGKIVQVMLPLQIREVVNEYIFTFKIYPHEKLMGTHERYKVYKAKMFVGIATVLIATMLIFTVSQ